MANIQLRSMVLAGNQPRNTPGNDYAWIGGPQNEGIVAELHGKFYMQTYAQKLWAASLTTAAAIPINTTTNGVTFAVWNPSGNPYSIVPVAFILGYTGTTGVAGAFGYYFRSGTGSDIATGSRVAAFTAVASQPQPGVLGQTYGGNAKVASAVTLDVAGTLSRWSQFSQSTPATNNTQGPYTLIEYFDGSMIIPPGTLWYPAASAASGATFMQTLIAYEAPWP